jgi:AcrR family transcriptional regulator
LSERFYVPQQTLRQTSKKGRRRGPVLENAILNAAWKLFNQDGYASLTMEDVAKLARTNKSVLYRRWPGKAKLVVAAMQQHLPKPTGALPDTGSLRDDLLAYLRSLTRLFDLIGFENLRGLVNDFIGSEDIDIFALIQVKPQGNRGGKQPEGIMMILERANARGEIELDKVSPRVIPLLILLLRNEILSAGSSIEDAAITEIVDDIFMPLVRPG